ncbi:MAG: antibiotic biosynthesis monooxygenase [Atopobiaceae bacterium]|nr:antibiotic biosynthesis monooxygenase [Atopobiaceae bacterium]
MITRLFKLVVNPDRQEAYNEVGANNLTSSHKKEAGTLAMYSTHVPEDPTCCYVFEVYADDDAYNTHVASGHFQAFARMAGEVLTDRAVYQLQPQLLVEKEGPLLVNGPNDIEPHLVYVDVRPGAEEAFLAAITANMRTAVEVEPGVLVMYAATMADQPTRWVFWEVYASAEAYAAHRETQHFKQYLAATEDIVVGKEFHVLTADTLVSKGSLGWSPR